ncbi:MAG: DnaA regulatory inactivator Hda [Betaproteobacteria bacterium]
MKQLALGIIEPPASSFDNFVSGRNAELLAALRNQCQGDAGERIIYIWGVPGCGRTHLLGAMAQALLIERRPAVWFPDAPGDGSQFVLVDDVDCLDDARQVALFGVFNAVREAGGCLLAAGNVPPAQLRLRPELLTRLAWGLVYHVHSLDDDDKAEALERHAQARGLHLPTEVSAYLLRHIQRDLPSLMAILDALDQFSLEAQRPITIPLLREILLSAKLADASVKEGTA